MQTVNALHRKQPVDFGIFLGDVINNAQHNELRWFIDILDGRTINPNSDPKSVAATDFMSPFKAAGLDPAIRWYEVIGNHDHFWTGVASLRDFPQQFRLFDIVRNSDNTISIFAVNVDPAVRPGSPAATSRSYAVAAYLIFNGAATLPYQPSGAYNMELVKQLSPEMQTAIQRYGAPVSK